jgi:hypothetical protein
VSTVKTLFKQATSHKRKALKSERRAAFEKLRQLSQYGSADEIAEAKHALNHSRLYKIHDGNVTSILRAIESQERNNAL